MSVSFSIRHREGYAAVQVSGRPSLAEFVDFIGRVAVESTQWPHARGLFDLRGIETLRAVTDHVAIGRAVAEHLRHMHKVASIVPVDRVTGISRKAAQEGGVNLAVFVSEEEAVGWLLAD